MPFLAVEKSFYKRSFPLSRHAVQPNGAQHNVRSMDPPLISVPLSHSQPPRGLAPAQFDNHLTLIIGLNRKSSVVKRHTF